MQDNFDIQLNQKIKSLPVIKHSNDLWNKVQNELDFDERLNSQAKQLPKYSHNSILWNNIQRETKKRGKRIKLYYLSGIAASIMLFISIVQYTSNNTKYSKNYSVEFQKHTEHLSILNSTDDVNTMLQQFCYYSNINCNSPDFMRIKSELVRLEIEIHKLNQVILNYGESDELIQCLIRMENQKSEFINELLKS